MSLKGHFMRASVALLAVAAVPALAQNYPEKPIRIVAAGAGGTTDTISRILSAGLSPVLGQPFIIDNRGGLGTIPGEVALKGQPDGYTLLIHTGNMWISNMLAEKKSYDPLRDFAPISQLSQDPSILVVHPSLPVKSVRDLIDLIKKNPGKINYASGPSGSASHVSGAMFVIDTKLDLVHVGYKGAEQALTDVLANRAQFMFASAGAATPMIKAGQLKAIAVTSAGPSTLAPGLPTVAATGVPNFIEVGITGMWAPAGTPEAVIRKLNAETNRFINLPETKAKLFNVGIEVVGTTPEQLTQVMKAGIADVDKLIKDTGLHQEQ